MEEELSKLEKTNKKLLSIFIILLVTTIIATILMIYRFYSDDPCMPAPYGTEDIFYISTFNSKLSDGIGENVLGAGVLSMLETVELYMRNDNELDMTITLNGIDITKDISSGKNNIRKTSRYNVEASKSEDGCINNISITSKI